MKIRLVSLSVAAAVAVAVGSLSAGTASARPLPRQSTILTGAATSASNFASWKRAFGGRLNIRMQFVAWAYNINPASVLAGPGIPMVSWEPWQPPPAGESIGQQGAPQPTYSNQAIAAGRWDAYITNWARAIKAYRSPVIVRFAHEFNGTWYPWSHNPKAYVAAWRHVWNVFHRVGAGNVTWVWSFNPGSTAPRWTRAVSPYWPGRKYVDVIGGSAVRFEIGSDPGYDTEFLRLAHQMYRLPTMITESNVAFDKSTLWLAQMRNDLKAIAPYNEGYVWCQLPSQQEARIPSAGDMNWDARTVPAAAAALAKIAALPF